MTQQYIDKDQERDPNNLGNHAQNSEQERDPLLDNLLNIVKDEVEVRSRQRIDRYRMPLGKADGSDNLINPDKVYVSDPLTQPTQKEVKVNPVQQTIDSTTSILEIFRGEKVQRKLLILGEPGSGKTTLLLELAQAFIEQAEKHESEAIPVLIDLASWLKSNRGFSDWVTEELNGKYGLNKTIGESFLSQNKILPLFDGLDEVKPKLKKDCAAALNSWLIDNHEQKPIGAVICCGREEYETSVSQKLCLKNSILLQPLTEEQIRAYLATLHLEPMWSQIQQTNDLKQLLEQPLFLSIFGFVALQKTFDIADWNQQNTRQEQIHYLFDCYWDAVMDRPLIDPPTPHIQEPIQLSKTYGSKPFPEKSAVKTALIFAANGMSGQHPKTTKESELLIEKLQPSWLPLPRQKLFYAIIVGLIVGLISGLMIGLILGLSEGLYFGRNVLLGVLIFELLSGIQPIETVERFQFSTSHFTRREIIHKILESLIGGVYLGLFCGMCAVLTGKLSEVLYGMILGLFLVSIFGLMQECKAALAERIILNQGIKNSIHNSLLLTISITIFISLSIPTQSPIHSFFEQENAYSVTAAVILFAAIPSAIVKSGCWPLTQHIALRVALRFYGYAPIRYDKLLDYCTERLLLQRIGGRYRFMHPLLQDYFAKMPLD